jgi:hypothetical protein
VAVHHFAYFAEEQLGSLFGCMGWFLAHGGDGAMVNDIFGAMGEASSCYQGEEKDEFLHMRMVV